MCSLSVVCKMNDDNSIESIEQTHGIKEALPEKRNLKSNGGACSS